MRFVTSAASTLTAVVALMLVGCGGSANDPAPCAIRRREPVHAQAI